jgi:hypothetical protein
MAQASAKYVMAQRRSFETQFQIGELKKLMLK